MVVKPSDHVAEFESEMDVLNFIFGSAFGGYVGIVIATDDLSDYYLWILVLLLANLAAFLLLLKEVARRICGVRFYGLGFP